MATWRSTLLECRPSQSCIALIVRALIFVLLPLNSSYCTPLQAPLVLPASSANASRVLSKEEHLANTSTFSHLHQTASESLQELKARSNQWSIRRGGHRTRPAVPRYNLASCSTGNAIDDCWRCDPNWQANRKKLADCAIGFGRAAIGGKHGKIYTVTDAGNDDSVTPKPGTLRHAVIQEEPLWIIFASDMTIRLKQELIMNSYKTIDGRGRDVHIAGGPCITIQDISNVIIHGIHIHDCKPGGNAVIRSSPSRSSHRGISDGDGISISGATNVWIDHCSLSRCTDGIIDATKGSTAITISNNHFTNHDKVILLGHVDSYVADKNMQVTVAFNRFGPGLVQRMPRCRHGFFEVVNNDYLQWGMYAIGGSAAPTIISRGNRFTAPADRNAKEVTKRIDTPKNQWESWDWQSEGDMFLNGAYFTSSGKSTSTSYKKATTIGPKASSLVPIITSNAGALTCKTGTAC